MPHRMIRGGTCVPVGVEVSTIKFCFEILGIASDVFRGLVPPLVVITFA